MTSVSVIRFADEKLGRIAPTESIRHPNKKKFAPVSAMDLPDGLMDVKWQKSLANGDFYSDGYYPAEILAIAGKYFACDSFAFGG